MKTGIVWLHGECQDAIEYDDQLYHPFQIERDGICRNHQGLVSL